MRANPLWALGLALGLLAGLVSGLGALSAAAAETRAEELARVLRTDEVIAVLREEGIAFGAQLDGEMLNGQGGEWWAAQVDALYDPGRMADAVQIALNKHMNGDQIARSLDYFTSDRGRRILSLEVSARRAMLTSEIEEAARENYAAHRGGDDPKLAAITRLVTVNDLTGRNVQGTLRASFYFRRGLVDGGASKLSEAQIASDVWAGAEETRTQTEDWLFSYLLFAYSPLPVGDIEDYVAYCETDAGQALNHALFDGFDRMYQDISRALGLMTAQAVTASEL